MLIVVATEAEAQTVGDGARDGASMPPWQPVRWRGI